MKLRANLNFAVGGKAYRAGQVYDAADGDAVLLDAVLDGSFTVVGEPQVVAYHPFFAPPEPPLPDVSLNDDPEVTEGQESTAE